MEDGGWREQSNGPQITIVDCAAHTPVTKRVAERASPAAKSKLGCGKRGGRPAQLRFQPAQRSANHLFRRRVGCSSLANKSSLAGQRRCSSRGGRETTLTTKTTKIPEKYAKQFENERRRAAYRCRSRLSLARSESPTRALTYTCLLYTSPSPRDRG